MPLSLLIRLLQHGPLPILQIGTFGRTVLLSKEEIELRLAVLRVIRDTKVEYGAYRNPKFWTGRHEVFYPKPDVSATQALLDVGRGQDDLGITKDKCDAMYIASHLSFVIPRSSCPLPTSRSACVAETSGLG